MRTCPFCGTENEPFFRFCLGCGADLDEALGVVDEAPSSAAKSPAPASSTPARDTAPEKVVAEKRVESPVVAASAAPRSAPQQRPPSQPIGVKDAPPVKQTTPGDGRPSAGPPPSARHSRPVDTRAPETRAKTLDPGSMGKVGTSAAAQAVAQAQVDAAERRSALTAAGLLKELKPTPETNKAQVETKRASSPEVASPMAKRQAVDARPATTQPARAKLVIILEDGTDGTALDLNGDSTVLGREGADINFQHDDFLAPRHAELFFKSGVLHLKPLKSTNGVFLQVHQEVELESGDVFRIGQQLLAFESLALVTAESPVVETKDRTMRLGSPLPEGAWGRLGQLIAPETMGSVYLLGGTEVYLGRERCDITSPGDGFVSGLHAVIAQRTSRFFLKDLGSSNGTYLRLTKAMPVRRGMLILAGQQLFRVEQ